MLTCQRERFRLAAGVHYLNCAYLSPLARTVEEAGVRGLRSRRSPTGFPSEVFFRDSDRLRDRFAAVLGAEEPSRVAILPAVSYGIAVAARNVEARAGQNVVLAEDQFPSNVYAWHALARRRGLEVRTVRRPRRRPPVAATWNERILEAIDGDTAVVALAHVQWTDGTLFDLEAVGRVCREHGAALVLDATQSVGASPLDLRAVRPDAVVCAAYKWLLGPYSLALGWFGPRFDDGMPLEETWIARRGSRDFQRLVAYEEAYAPGAVRYDVGERSSFILVPMAIAALELVSAWGPERIQAYTRRLLGPLIREARERSLPVEADEGRAGHILGLRLPAEAEVRRLRERLAARDVHVSLRGDAVRVSPHVYNDEEDVAALTEALRGVL